jgi:hypothetical protein
MPMQGCRDKMLQVLPMQVWGINHEKDIVIVQDDIKETLYDITYVNLT